MRQQRSARRWVLSVLLALLLLCLASAAVVYTVDPYQYYRSMEAGIPASASTMQAYYNIGFARHYAYDTLMTGSSTTENFRSSQVDALFGGQALNLPFRAGTFSMYAKLLGPAFATHALRRVFISLDLYALAADADDTSMVVPDYLYDDNPFSDVYYLLSFDTLEQCYLQMATAGTQDATTGQLDTLYAWEDYVTFSQVQVLENYRGLHRAKAEEPMPAQGDEAEMEANLQRHLEPFFQAHPETEFILFFPPYHQLHWFSYQNSGALDRMLYHRWYYTQRLLAYENVRLFDFAVREDWVTDWDRYADMSHFDAEINREMLEDMAAGRMEVTSLAQMEEHNNILRGYAERFELPKSFLDQMQ